MCCQEPPLINFFQIIGGAITAAIGGFVGYLSAKRVSSLNARQQAACALRASFASQVAYLKSTEGYILGIEETREFLYTALISTHAAELERFRFFVKSKNVATYDNACEKYKELIHPGFAISVGDQEPSVFFITKIRELLNLSL